MERQADGPHPAKDLARHQSYGPPTDREAPLPIPTRRIAAHARRWRGEHGAGACLRRMRSAHDPRSDVRALHLPHMRTDAPVGIGQDAGAVSHRDSTEIICASVFQEDRARLERLVKRARESGDRRANMSSTIRRALEFYEMNATAFDPPDREIVTCHLCLARVIAYDGRMRIHPPGCGGFTPATKGTPPCPGTVTESNPQGASNL